MAFELIWEQRGVYRRYFGDVTIAERKRSFERICADPRFDDLRYTITDYLHVDSYEITDEATEEIAALHVGPLQSNPSILITAVVTDDRIIAAIRYFIALKFTEQPYEIFPTLEGARSWIAAARARYVPPPPRPGRRV